MTDLVVVGAGPAGLATAIRARQRGMQVRVVDCRKPPIDKACGEGVMPDGVELLGRLGVEIDPARRRPFVGIRYLDGDRIAESRFPGAAGWGIRRTVLHRALVRRAESAGVELVWGVSVGERPRSRWVVAADGLRSPLRRAAGLEGQPSRTRRFGSRRHFATPPWTDHVEVYWADAGEAYVTPVDGDTVGVAYLWTDRKPTDAPLAGLFPALADRLAGAAAITNERGAGPLQQRVRGVVAGNLALVGDAAGYLDAITGEGISVALHEAFAVVDAVVRGDLRSYATAHRKIVALPNAMTRLLLAIERRPALRRRVIGALAAEPDTFRRLLAIHARAAAPRSLGIAPAMRLLRRVVAPAHV